MYSPDSPPQSNILETPQTKPEQSPKLISPFSSPKEAILSEREPVGDKKPLLGGLVGDATFINLKDDGSGVFKPHLRFNEIKKMQFINRERAVYLIDMFLGFGIVPPTIIRNIDNQVGSFQEFIPDAMSGMALSNERISDEEIMKMFVLDIITFNTDRKEDNFLIKDGSVKAIDNGHSLGMYVSGSFSKLIDEYGNTAFTYHDLSMFTKPVPSSVISSLNRFASWNEGQTILQDLLAELISDEFARYFVKRILALAGSINEKGMIETTIFLDLLPPSPEPIEGYDDDDDFIESQNSAGMDSRPPSDIRHSDDTLLR